MKNYSFAGSHRRFSKLTRSRLETHCCLSNDSFKEMFMVSSRGMLVNNELMSRLAIKQSEFCFSISLAKSNESFTMYSLEVKSLSIGTRNLAILYLSVPMAERVGRKAGQPSITVFYFFIFFLWSFARP